MKKKFLFFILITLSAFLCNNCANKIIVIYAPIEVKNLPKQFIVSEIQPKEIKLRVIGYKSALNNLSLFKIIYKIDLSEAKEGVISLQPTKDAIELPPNISIVEMTPPKISIKIEKNS